MTIVTVVQGNDANLLHDFNYSHDFHTYNTRNKDLHVPLQRLQNSEALFVTKGQKT